MALFDTKPDDQLIDSWISSIREELHSAVSQKVLKYNFDFFKSEPLSLGRYDWNHEIKSQSIPSVDGEHYFPPSQQLTNSAFAVFN